LVVKNIGPQLARVTGVTGAAVLGTGETVLIINPVALTKRADIGPTVAVPAAARPPTLSDVATVAQATAQTVRQLTVLVVDDSLTVRKVTSRLLAREGYQVIVAKDGVEAIEKMRDVVPDVMLTDIEMPRMDGFDLTRIVRADERLKKLPIIMITSRAANKHKIHAAELGVDVFLGKPYEESALLERLSDFFNRTA
jgi:chemosensory pili system protein ChpA (sensor histidine kinase/response regulator)